MEQVKKGKEYTSGKWFYVEVFSAEQQTSIQFETYTDSMSKAVRIVKRYCQENLEGLFQMNNIKSYDDFHDIPYGLDEVIIPESFSWNINQSQRRKS